MLATIAKFLVTPFILVLSFAGYTIPSDVQPVPNGIQEQLLGGFSPTGGGTYRLGQSIGSTDSSIKISTFKEPISNIPYTMVMMNTDVAYGTIAPQSTQSEFISFTGITQNADGSATLTGVVRGLSRSFPYTASSTFRMPHAGQSIFILSDAPGLFNEYLTKRNDETITGLKTFATSPIVPTGISASTTIAASIGYVNSVALSSAPDMATTIKGVAKLSVAPASSTNPIVVGDNDPRIPTQNENNALAGTFPSATNTYVTFLDTATTSALTKVVMSSSTNGQIDPSFIASSTASTTLYINKIFSTSSKPVREATSTPPYVWYQNTTGKTLGVFINGACSMPTNVNNERANYTFEMNTSATTTGAITVGFQGFNQGVAGSAGPAITFFQPMFVPNNYFYSVLYDFNTKSCSISNWVEYSF